MLNVILNFVAIVSTIALLFCSIQKSDKFLFYLFLIKPFIDLTVNTYLIGSFNALQISGAIVFVFTGVLYIQKYSSHKIENHGIIWFFIFFQAFSFTLALISGNKTIFGMVFSFLKVFDAYFIYFCSMQILSDFEKRKKFYKLVWLTTLSVSIITVLSYWSGVYNIDITGGITRVGGLFNDPGSPSYLAVLSLIFSTLYRSLSKKRNFDFKLLYLFTIGASTFILIITLTKSAFLMLFVFLILWLGWHKKKFLIIFPLIVAASYIAYTDIESVQVRMKNEVRFVKEQSVDAAISVGTGRVGRWKRLFEMFSEDYSLEQKIFGSSRTYLAHNQFIAYLMQIGIIGLLIFVIIIWRFYARLIKIYRKTRSNEVFAAIVLLSCYMALSLSGHPFEWTTILWYLMIMLGMVNIRNLRTVI